MIIHKLPSIVNSRRSFSLGLSQKYLLFADLRLDEKEKSATINATRRVAARTIQADVAMRTPGSGNRYTAYELEQDTERVAEFLTRVRAVVAKMRESKVPDVRVDKDASYRACLKGVKVWCKSVDDGLDEAVAAARNGVQPIVSPEKKNRPNKPKE